MDGKGKKRKKGAAAFQPSAAAASSSSSAVASSFSSLHPVERERRALANSSKFDEIVHPPTAGIAGAKHLVYRLGRKGVDSVMKVDPPKHRHVLPQFEPLGAVIAKRAIALSPRSSAIEREAAESFVQRSQEPAQRAGVPKDHNKNARGIFISFIRSEIEEKHFPTKHRALAEGMDEHLSTASVKSILKGVKGVYKHASSAGRKRIEDIIGPMYEAISLSRTPTEHTRLLVDSPDGEIVGTSHPTRPTAYKPPGGIAGHAAADPTRAKVAHAAFAEALKMTKGVVAPLEAALAAAQRHTAEYVMGPGKARNVSARAASQVDIDEQMRRREGFKDLMRQNRTMPQGDPRPTQPADAPKVQSRGPSPERVAKKQKLG